MDVSQTKIECTAGGFGYNRLDDKFYTNCNQVDAGTSNQRMSSDGKVLIKVDKDGNGNKLLLYGILDTKDCSANAFYSWQWNERDDTVFSQVGAKFDVKASVSGYISTKLKGAWDWMWSKVGYKNRDASRARVFAGVVQSGFHCETKFKVDQKGKFTTDKGTFMDDGSTVFVCDGEVLFGVPHGACKVFYTGKTTDLDNVFEGKCANGTPVEGYKQIWEYDEGAYTKFWGTFLSPTASADDCWYSKMNTGRRFKDGQTEYVYLRRTFDMNLTFEDGKTVKQEYKLLPKLCTNRAVKSTVRLGADMQVPAGVYKEFAERLVQGEDDCKIQGGAVSLSGGAKDMDQLALLGIDTKCKVPHIEANWLAEVEDKVAQLVLRLDALVQNEQEYNSMLETQKLLPDHADPASVADGAVQARKALRNEKRELSTAVVAYVRSFRDALERCPRDGPGALRPVARSLAEAITQTFRGDYKQHMRDVSDWLKYEF